VVIIRDSTGAVVRRFTDTDAPDTAGASGINIPGYWIRPFRRLSPGTGMRRFVWDLHYPPHEGERAEYPMSAIYHDTPRGPLGPWVLPGRYTVDLIVNRRTYSRPLVVKMDPRVTTSAAALVQQFTSSMTAWNGMHIARAAITAIDGIRSRIAGLTGGGVPPGSLRDSLTALDGVLAAFEGAGGTGRRSRAAASDGTVPTLRRSEGVFRSLFDILQESDAAPTARVVEAAAAAHKEILDLNARWNALRTGVVASMDEKLRALHHPSLKGE
jgi:hypothetical protein